MEDQHTPEAPTTPSTAPTVSTNTPPSPSTGAVDFTAEARLALRVFTLHEDAEEMVANKPEATLLGGAILLIPPVIKFVIVFLIFQGWHPTSHPAIFINLLGSLIAIFVPFLIAKRLFGGQGGLEQYFRILSYARFPHVFTVFLYFIPFFYGLVSFLDLLIDLWILYVVFTLLVRRGKVTHEQAALSVIGTFLLYLIFMGMLWIIF